MRSFRICQGGTPERWPRGESCYVCIAVDSRCQICQTLSRDEQQSPHSEKYSKEVT